MYRIALFFLLSISLISCSKSNGGGVSFEGTWQAVDSERAEHQSYWKIYGDQKGFLCHSDDKSQTATMIQGNKLTSYDYGSGDVLSLENGLLKRVGIDHGIEDTVYYKRVSDVPAWCDDQEILYYTESL